MSAYLRGASWKRITADGVLFTGDALLHEVLLYASTYPASVLLYDGLDAISGRLIGTFRPPAGEIYPVPFPCPLHIETGLYADLVDNMVECGAVWSELADT